MIKPLLTILFLIGFCPNLFAKPNDKPKPIRYHNTYNTYITNYNIKNQHKVEFIARISDARKITTELYGNYDFNNEVYGVGIRFIFKVGRSYTEKLIEELRKKIYETQMEN